MAELLVFEKTRFLKQLVKFLKNTHALVFFTVAVTIGMATFIVYVVPAFIMNWPLLGLKFLYIILLLASLVVLINKRSELLKWLMQIKKNSPFSIFIIPSALVIITSYITSLRAGGLVDGDARVFIAMINQWISTGHINLADPYFGWNGVLNLGYSTNLLMSLRAVAGSLFNITAQNVWLYSNAFFMFLIWISFYSLAWVFIPDKKLKSWAYVILSLLPILYTSYFFTASLPAAIASAWIILIIIGFKHYFKSNNFFLLLIGCLLISTTHVLYAAMTAAFIVLLITIMIIYRTLDRKKAITLVSLFLLLIIPVVAALSFPHHFVGTGSENLSFAWPTINFMGFRILRPNNFTFSPVIIFDLALLASIFLVHKVIKQKKYLFIFYILLTILLIMLIDNLLISLIGYGYIIYANKDKAVRLLLLCLLFFYGLFAYNPIIIKLAEKTVPFWAFTRLNQLNIFGYAASIIGLLFVINFIVNKLSQKKAVIISGWIALILVPTILPFFSQTAISYPWHAGFSSAAQARQLSSLQALSSLKEVVENKLVFSNNPVILSSLPDVVNANFVNVDWSYSPLANGPLRNRCAEHLKKTLSELDLNSARVNIVISDITISQDFDKLAASKPYLHFIKQIKGYKLYKFRTLSGSFENKSQYCNFPYRQ